MPRNPDKKKCTGTSLVYGEDGWPILLNGERQFKPCENWAMRGLEVCDRHGGMLPTVYNKHRRTIQEQKVMRKIADFLAECEMPNLHPMDELLDIVRRTGAMVRLLGMMVGELHPSPEFVVHSGESGHAMELKGWYGPDHLGDAAPHVLLTLYGQWVDRHGRACKLALDANIDERMVRNAEATTEALFVAVTRALDAADLTHEQQGAFKTVLAGELRKVVGPLEGQPALVAG